MKSVDPLPAPVATDAQPSIGTRLVGGASALGAASILERGCNFAANLLAARFAGPQVFGAYSLALTTANNVATYAGAGIGTTANRFAGMHRPGSPSYRKLVRSLTLVSVASAVLAILLLVAGAGPLARILLRSPALTPLLQVAAVSAGMMILLECLRGFLIGERLYRQLAVLALCGGICLIIALPTAARIGAIPMIACQAAVSAIAIVVCLAIGRRTPETSADPVMNEPAIPPSPAAIWRFGVVQFAGVLGLNAAGWWVAALVARADITLTQAGLFAVANQLRNLTSLGPNLFTQSSYSLLADEGEGAVERRGAVLVHCTYFAALLSLAIGGTLAALAGWGLPLVFGSSFRGASVAGSLAMATAVVHMTGSASAARLTIASLPRTGLINAVWAILTIVAATIVVPRWGAAAAMGVYFGVHFISACLVFVALRDVDVIPVGLSGVLFSTLAVAVALASLAVARAQFPGSDALISALMLALTIGGTAALAVHGSAKGWLPRSIGLRNFRSFLGGGVVGRPA